MASINWTLPSGFSLGLTNVKQEIRGWEESEAETFISLGSSLPDYWLVVTVLLLGLNSLFLILQPLPVPSNMRPVPLIEA